ncbi:MAG TPA: hypothetical protein VKR57_08890 [Terriglobales bacterium]|nr:hypothetical protein [Terriglobales bacterium]
MAKPTSLAKVFSVIVFSVLCIRTSIAQTATTYYVDANFAGGTRNGSASNPWQSLSDSGAWTAINNSLASSPVTVYFSARNPSSDTNEQSTVQLSINRTDMSTNVLTLDGMDEYNTNSSTPSWAPYTGSSRFQVTASYPVNVQNGSCTTTQETNYWTFNGFVVVATNGQPLEMSRSRHVIIENSDLSTQAGANGGPGLIIGCSNLGAAGPGGFAATDVTIQNNKIHDTFGEAIYVGGWYGCNQFGDGQTNCPNGVNPGGSHSPGAGGNCTGATTRAGDTLLIQNNTVYNAGARGGEREQIDIKDCWTNITVQNNNFYLTNPTGSAANTGGSLCVQSNSAALVQDNFCHDVEQYGIGFVNTYNEYTGFWSNSVARNNIVVNTAVGTNYNYGFGISFSCDENCTANSVHLNPVVENNSIYNVHKVGCSGCSVGIYIDPGYSSFSTVTVQNNIVTNTDGLDFSSPGSGTLATHGHNLYWNSGGGNVANYGGTSYTASTITSFESTSVSADPLFVNTGTPYIDVNFGLQTGSPALGVGADLSSSFTTDYFGHTRTTPWDLSAIASSAQGGSPNPPTGLTASVN